MISDKSQTADVVSSAVTRGGAVSDAEGATALDTMLCKPYWEVVDDKQTAGWVLVDSTTAQTWSNIGTTQNPDWQRVDTNPLN